MKDLEVQPYMTFVSSTKGLFTENHILTSTNVALIYHEKYTLRP